MDRVARVSPAGNARRGFAGGVQSVARGLVAVADQHDATGGVGGEHGQGQAYGAGDVRAVGNAHVEVVIDVFAADGNGDHRCLAVEDDETEPVVGRAGLRRLPEPPSQVLDGGWTPQVGHWRELRELLHRAAEIEHADDGQVVVLANGARTGQHDDQAQQHDAPQRHDHRAAKPVHRRQPSPAEHGQRGHGEPQQQYRGLIESETHGPSPSVAASGMLGGAGGGAGFTVSSRWRKYR